MARYRYALVCLLFMACSKDSDETVESGSSSANIPELEAQLLGIVNGHRLSNGLDTLSFNAVAYQYANEHTDYMIAKGELSHANFNSRASKIADETKAVNVQENVARNYETAQSALEGWLASEPHKNTLEGDFTHTAISIKEDDNGSLYYTQIFFR